MVLSRDGRVCQSHERCVLCHCYVAAKLWVGGGMDNSAIDTADVPLLFAVNQLIHEYKKCITVFKRVCRKRTRAVMFMSLAT